MTRKIALPVLALAALTLLVPASTASAQDLAVFGSYWDTEDLEDSAGAGAKLSFGDGLLGMELRATYYPDLTERFADVLDDEELGALDLEVEAIPVDLGLTLGSGNLHAVGGVTWFLLDSNVLEVDDEVGLYVGGALEAGRGNIGFFAEALYRQVEGTVTGELDAVDAPDELDDIVVDDVEIDLGGFAVNAGVVFRL